MNEDVVFEGTPLASYLEENELDLSHADDLAGWGIEPPLEATSGTATRLFRGLRPLPLMLNAETGKASLRKERFRALLKSAVQARLGENENMQFLERFRYIVVSSDLLDARVSVHNPRPAEEMDRRLEDEERRRILLDEDGPWSILKMRHSYWVGGGGVVVIMATLLTWGVKKNQMGGAKKSSAVLVVVLCMALYLFAHSRRRTLRLLRAKAIAYASQFVQHNQQFDMAVTRCVSLITEVDLLLQGYRPELAGERKFGTAAMDSRMAAKHLRSGLSATLYLAMNSYIDAVTECLEHASHLDLMRYLDIYDVKVEELGLKRDGERLVGPMIILSRELYYGPDGANASLHRLKQEFSKLHLLRRTLMCCLLSIPSSGECDRAELRAWTCATYHAKSIQGLLLQLSKSVVNYRHLLNEDTKSSETVSQSLDWRSHTRSINSISSTLQHVEARLQVLADTTDSVDYRTHYDLVGEEIRHMLDAWERGFHDLGNDLTPVRDETSMDEQHIPSEDSTLADDGDLEWRPQSPRVEMLNGSTFGHRRTETSSTTSSSMTIIQGIADDDYKRRPALMGMTRQERIKFMHQAREAEKERKFDQTVRSNLVSELSTVISKRMPAA